LLRPFPSKLQHIAAIILNTKDSREKDNENKWLSKKNKTDKLPNNRYILCPLFYKTNARKGEDRRIIHEQIS